MHDTDTRDAACAGLDQHGLAALHARIAPHFRRREARERVRRYLEGLLGHIERKNGWQLAEALGESGPQGMQRLLNAADWDAEAVCDELRASVVEHLADEPSGVLVIDETGFVKKGHAVGGRGAPRQRHGRTPREPADRRLSALRL